MAFVLRLFETDPQIKYILIFHAVLKRKLAGGRGAGGGGRVAVALIVESDKKFGLTDHNSNETIILKLRLNICPMARLLRGRNACESEAPCL